MAWLAALGVIVVVAAVAIAVSAKVVQPHERLVIFRMGRTDQSLVRGPGMALLVPVFDRGIRFDMRPRTAEIVDARMPTDDGKAIGVDATLRYQVVDALKSVVNVAYLDGAIVGVSETTLRALAVEQRQADLLVGRSALNAAVQAKLAEVLPRWGVQLDGVEITDVRPLDSVR